jgi:hypothetical protein
MGVKGIILSLLMTNMIKRFFIHEVKWKNGFTAFRQMVAGVIANDLTSGTALR